jgi:hypothetical protein
MSLSKINFFHFVECEYFFVLVRDLRGGEDLFITLVVVAKRITSAGGQKYGFKQIPLGDGCLLGCSAV